MLARRLPFVLTLLLGISFVSVGCSSDNPLTADTDAGAQAVVPTEFQAHANGNACWGQASRVFAQMGEMGAHSSSQGNPRLGLRNLARALFEAGILPDDSMQSLGAFVAAELGLNIDACQ